MLTLHGLLIDTLRLFAWLFLLSVVFLPLERLFAVRHGRLFSRSTASDLGFYFLNGLLPGLLLAPPLSLLAVLAHHAVPHAWNGFVASWPLWLRAIAAMFISEVGSYWGHRWTHQVPFLWRFHAVHHAPEKLYFLLSSRAHPLDVVFVRLCAFAPLYVLGIAAPQTRSGNVIALLVIIFSTAWGFFIHSNIRWRLGPLEWLIATPAFHHWHHTKAPPLDRNFAATFPFVDRIFGTHYLPREFPREYGTETALPETMGGQLLFPMRPAGVPLAEAARVPSADAPAA